MYVKKWMTVFLVIGCSVGCGAETIDDGSGLLMPDDPQETDFTGVTGDHTEDEQTDNLTFESTPEEDRVTPPSEETDSEVIDNPPPPDEGAASQGCLGVDIANLEPCCSEDNAHCVPDELIPEFFATLVDPCPNGGLCVPDSVLTAQEVFVAAACVSLAGAAGACLSACIPQVAEFASLLPQDTCPVGELCAPCVNPLTGEDIGVCGQPLQCPNAGDSFEDEIEDDEILDEKGDDETDVPPVEEYSCDNPPTEPLIDVSTFNPCCEDAHCVPHAFVPLDQQNMLDDCDGGTGLCVPDTLIETLGYLPPTYCELPGEIEGRCLSTCIPEVAANADLAPQLNCAENERCTPCCNPLTGEITGACDGLCEQGPEVCDYTYETCCGDAAKCIPEELIPVDQQQYLAKKTCKKGSLCAPNDLQDPTFVPVSCTGKILFTNPYSGVCLPTCIKIPFDFLIWKGSCNKGYECVPCLDPLTGQSTDAPGC